MSDLTRDTIFGQLVRLVSKNRHFQFPDESDPTLWKVYIESQSATSNPTEQSCGSDEANTDSLNATNTNHGKGDEQKIKTDSERHNISEFNTNSIIYVSWYGPNDQENPQNWPASQKLIVTIQICILNFGIYIGSSIYTPGEEMIMQEFSVGETLATLGLSAFVLGYGLGPMLFFPMSEMAAIGRSRIYFWTLLVFVLLQLPIGYATNMTMLLVFRFLTGFFGGPVLATGGATILDMYPPTESLYWIGIFGASGVLGPVMGPLVGGFAAQSKGWRWTIWELAWLCTVVLVVLFFFMPETNAQNILYRRAKRMQKATGNPRLQSHSEIDSAGVTIKDHLITLSRAFTLTFSEPVVFFIDLYSALLYGILYIWFESFPLVFGDIYGFNNGQQGLVFLGIFVGGLITLPCYLLWIQKRLAPKFSRPPVYPEMILPPTLFGAFALPICLFWYGWSSRHTVHWMVPLVGSGFFTVSIITLFMPLLSYLGMAYPQYAASVLAGNALFRASCGVVFPLFARALFHNLGIGPGNSLLGGFSIVFLPIPFILFYYGQKIRQHSKNATH